MNTENRKSLIDSIQQQAASDWKKKKKAVRKYRFGGGEDPHYGYSSFPPSRAAYKR